MKRISKNLLDTEYYTLEYASIPQRILAFIIDIVVVAFIAVLCALLLHKAMFEQLYIIYQIVLHSLPNSASIGENFAKIYPVNINNLKKEKGFFARYFLLFIPILFIEITYTFTILNSSPNSNKVVIATGIFVIMWIIPMFFSKEHTALHDIFSKTRMVKR